MFIAERQLLFKNINVEDFWVEVLKELLFIRQYFHVYCLTPNLHLTICRFGKKYGQMICLVKLFKKLGEQYKLFLYCA